MNELIYGKDQTKNIVASEVYKNTLINFIANGDKVEKQTRNFYYYVLLEDYDSRQECGRLEGRNDFQYFVKFKTKNEAYQYCRQLDYNGKNYHRVFNDVESAMLREGFTYFKGMTTKDVSVLSFDIETTGVTINENSFVLLISNTFRSRSGNITKRLFDYNDYNTPGDFIDAWCTWVRGIDPDILVGHNIFGFDFPYLANVAKLYKTTLKLGRNASEIKFGKSPRKFRKDGSQSYEYLDINIFGREIVDTMFLSYKYDVGRNYPSYGLKAIIKYEGLEKEDRQHWDFSKNKEPWNDKEDWAKFKQYAKDDADDSLALYDLQIPQFFYYAQSIPKKFQEIINTATGSQVNSFMMRAYLQRSKAVPMASDKADFEGAISLGNPGLYKNAFKVDVASLYPSIMMVYNVTNTKKDPDGLFLEAVKFFTEQRLENKRLAAKTDSEHYKHMSDGQKIMINSFYGFLGAPGLNFNYPEGAAEITRKGREILTGALDWCEKKGFRLINADTDSITYEPTSGTIEEHLEEINLLSPTGIIWENDGIYDSVLVVKKKNYALKTGNKVKIKGSALKATMKETALRDFLDDSINALLQGSPEDVERIYHKRVREIKKLEDIKPWCSKKTITDKVLNPKRTNEQRVLDAIDGEHVQEGDKIRVFFKSATELCLDKNFDGIYDADKLYEKLFKTVKILEPVLDMENVPNYKLKKNKPKLEVIC